MDPAWLTLKRKAEEQLDVKTELKRYKVNQEYMWSVITRLNIERDIEAFKRKFYGDSTLVYYTEAGGQKWVLCYKRRPDEMSRHQTHIGQYLISHYEFYIKGFGYSWSVRSKVKFLARDRRGNVRRQKEEVADMLKSYHPVDKIWIDLPEECPCYNWEKPQ